MSDPTHPVTTPPPAAAPDLDPRPQDMLGNEPSTLPDAGRIQLTQRRRPTLTTVLAGVVGAAALFAGGLVTGDALSHNDATAGAGGRSAQAGPGGSAPPTGRGGTSGEITAIEDGSLTLTTSDGASVAVTASDSTTVTITEDGGFADLVVGDTITVLGETGEDDVVEATRISVGGLSAAAGNFPGEALGESPKSPR